MTCHFCWKVQVFIKKCILSQIRWKCLKLFPALDRTFLTYEFKKSAILPTQISFNLWIIKLKFKIVVKFCIQNTTIPVTLQWNMNVAANFYVSHDILPVMPYANFWKTMHFSCHRYHLLHWSMLNRSVQGRYCTHWKDEDVKI